MNGTTVPVSLAREFAFDTAVRRKPLAGAADAGCYGNSIDFCLKSLARRDFGQNVSIDFHHVAVLATICVILPPAPSVLQEDSSDAWLYTRGSVRRASGFVLTDDSEVMPQAPLRGRE